jgi:DNA-binding transcriptional LysR family regulator
MRGTQFAELSAFVVVAQHLNFTRAAAHLGISAPTLSQNIRSLEERLGIRLFNRTTRSVALTEAGEHFLGNLQPLLNGIDEAIEAMNAFRGSPKGALRLNVARPAAMTFVLPLLPQFLAQYPEISVELVADDSHRDIVTGGFDAGVRLGERISKDMIAVRLLSDIRFIVIGSPAYLESHPHPGSPEDLGQHNCIRFRSDWDGAVQPWILERPERRVEVAPQGSLILNDLYLVMNAAVDGSGLSYLPEPLVASSLARGRLVHVLDEWSGPTSGAFLYYSSRRQMPAPLRAFIDFVRKQPQQHAILEVKRA